jgi:hypothetical protein
VLQFYATPEGQHLLNMSDEMTPAAIKLGQNLFINAAPKILQSLCNDYPELKDDAKVCGPPETKEKSQLRGTSTAFAGD